MAKRQAKVERKTSEVKVKIDISLDGAGKFDIDTGIPFFNHMLSQFAKHGYFAHGAYLAKLANQKQVTIFLVVDLTQRCQWNANNKYEQGYTM